MEKNILLILMYKGSTYSTITKSQIIVSGKYFRIVSLGGSDSLSRFMTAWPLRNSAVTPVGKGGGRNKDKAIATIICDTKWITRI